MNHISVFLNTKIRNHGIFSAIGNFFLAPFRYCFSGKTIDVKLDGRIAKVTSFETISSKFQPDQAKTSKQDRELRAELRGRPASILYFVLLLSGVPLILGSIFKAISFLSPKAREDYKIVKAKLTPRDFTLGSESEPIHNLETLANQLQNHLQTGQKTKALVIYAKNKDLDERCLNLIKDINPLKLILVGSWRQLKIGRLFDVLRQGRKSKVHKWDLSAFVDDFNEEDERENIVNSVETALNTPRSSFVGLPSCFFWPKTPPKKHVVYTVKIQNDLNQEQNSGLRI